MSFVEIKGKYNTARIFTAQVEETARAQIKELCDQFFAQNSKIRIMPDVHAGKGCTIGTTMTVRGRLVPNLVGVDIGCGLLCVKLGAGRLDLPGLDNFIAKRIPSGRNVRKQAHVLNREIDLGGLKCAKFIDRKRAELSIGTLGGGNHFIEVNRGESDDGLYLVVHSGSRHMGLEIAGYYQRLAVQKQTRLPQSLAYLEGRDFADYVHDMEIACKYAELNRRAMVHEISNGLNLNIISEISTIHNYLDTEAMILRKGAVSAKYNESLIIPLNMRDGSLLCLGKGNADWNFSAPHGAGRLMSRVKAKKALDLNDFKRQMDGIYTTSVNKDTLDEAPQAYKNAADILNYIDDTVTVTEVIKPVYNFKAAG